MDDKKSFPYLLFLKIINKFKKNQTKIYLSENDKNSSCASINNHNQSAKTMPCGK